MPFYEYECPHCGYDEEVLQAINDKPLKKCPSCGKKGLKKLMSAPVFRLKGSGWYETDFKGDKENKRNLAGADKEEAKAEAKVGRQGRREGRCQGRMPKPEAAKAEKSEPPSPRSRRRARARASSPRSAPSPSPSPRSKARR